MPFNPYYGYFPNPIPAQGGYGYPQYQQPQPQAQQNVYAFVNGVEGAKSYQMQPSQTVMLLDSESPVAYLKTSNGMGQSTLKYYRLVETSEEELRGGFASQKQSAEYATKEELSSLSKRVEELSKAVSAPKGYNRHDLAYVANMLFSDFYGVVGESADTFLKMASAFLDDKDGLEGKAYRYYVAMKD